MMIEAIEAIQMPVVEKWHVLTNKNGKILSQLIYNGT